MNDALRAKILLLYGVNPSCQNCIYHSYEDIDDDIQGVEMCDLYSHPIPYGNDKQLCPKEGVCDEWANEKKLDKIVDEVLSLISK